MAEAAVAPALTLEQKKEAARARARAAREAQQAGVTDALVSVSEAAANYIRESAAKNDTQQGVRLRILAGGCSGLEYKLDLLGRDEAIAPGDREIVSNGVKLVMDLKSSIHVTGSVIDYENSLLRRGFRISNPNATSTCSCGDSFGT